MTGIVIKLLKVSKSVSFLYKLALLANDVEKLSSNTTGDAGEGALSYNSVFALWTFLWILKFLKRD